MKPRRKALDKPRFLETVRQKWLTILLLYSLVLLMVNAWYKIDPIPFLSFIGTIGTTFIIGSSIDSAMKIQAAAKKQELETSPKEETTEE